MSKSHDKFLRIVNQKLKYFRYSKITIEIYVHYIEKFLVKVDEYPQHLTGKHFQQYLDNYNFSSGSQQNQIINAIKFLYEKVLDRKYGKVKFDRPKTEHRLPNVIPEAYLKDCLGKIKNKKHLTILSLAYSIGLRSGDILNLKLEHLSSKSMQVKIVEGKGKKDAYLPLYENVKNLLFDYCREYKTKEYLFEGQNGGKYSAGSLNKLVKKYISKEYHFHNLRNSFATHLLNKGVDISFIQQMLRHSDIKTTMKYLKITDKDLKNLPQLI